MSKIVKIEPGDPTYVLLDEWIPKSMTLAANETVLELARRYFSGFGPATAVDFATWAGIALGPARQAIAKIGQAPAPTCADKRRKQRELQAELRQAPHVV